MHKSTDTVIIIVTFFLYKNESVGIKYPASYLFLRLIAAKWVVVLLLVNIPLASLATCHTDFAKCYPGNAIWMRGVNKGQGSHCPMNYE